MKEFKRSKFIMIKDLAQTLLGSAVLFVLIFGVLAFIEEVGEVRIRLEIAIVISGVIAILVWLWAVRRIVVHENIRVTVDGDDFYFYQRNQEKYHFRISEVKMHSRIKTRGGDSECRLEVIDEQGKRVYIDCSPLGKSRYYGLLEALNFNF